MEEVVTINNQQYILKYPQPLSPEQKISIIDQIKGLSSNIYSLSSCSGPKQKGDTIAINAAPMGGTAPYTVTHYKKIGTDAPVQIGTQSGVAEAPNATTPTTTTLNYVVTNDDVRNSTGDPTPNPAQLPYVATALAVGKLRIITEITDSCPTGAQTCIEFCDTTLTCTPITCNLITQ